MLKVDFYSIQDIDFFDMEGQCWIVCNVYIVEDKKVEGCGLNNFYFMCVLDFFCGIFDIVMLWIFCFFGFLYDNNLIKLIVYCNCGWVNYMQ